MKKFNEDSALRSAWRRIFSRSPIVIQILKEGKRYVKKFNKDGTQAKRDSVEYFCDVCKTWVKASVKGKNNIAVDHIIPVIPIKNVSGKIENWNIFHDRLFCDRSNLQRICKRCHLFKTNKEKKERQIFKDNVILAKLTLAIEGALESDISRLKKELSKYTAKKKPDEIKKRAIELKEILLRPRLKKKRRNLE